MDLPLPAVMGAGSQVPGTRSKVNIQNTTDLSQVSMRMMSKKHVNRLPYVEVWAMYRSLGWLAGKLASCSLPPRN